MKDCLAKPLPLQRLPDGTINNCALKNYDDEENCQICKGSCPDKKGLLQDEFQKLSAAIGQLPTSQLAVPSSKKGDIDIHPGDRFQFTIGQETFLSGSTGGSFTVGPISADMVVQQGEDLESFTVRIRYVISLLWETEFQLKKKQYYERAKEVT